MSGPVPVIGPSSPFHSSSSPASASAPTSPSPRDNNSSSNNIGSSSSNGGSSTSFTFGTSNNNGSSASTTNSSVLASRTNSSNNHSGDGESTSTQQAPSSPPPTPTSSTAGSSSIPPISPSPSLSRASISVYPPDWLDDDASSTCMACSAPFTLFRRRHHCRACGKLFCKACSRNSMELPKDFRLDGLQRVCDNCRDALVLMKDGSHHIMMTMTKEDNETPFHEVTPANLPSVIRDMYANIHDNKEFLVEALSALAEFCADSTSNCDLAFGAGALDVLLLVLRTHAAEEALQSLALLVLVCLAARSSESGVQIAEAGGVELIVAGMRAYPLQKQVQFNGCCALGKLLSYGQNMARFGNAGGIDVILAAMDAWPTDEGLADMGCSALSYACADAQNMERLAALGARAIRPVVVAMRAFPTHADIQACGCAFLFYASAAPRLLASHVLLAPESDGVSALLAAMHALPEDMRVQDLCCSALVNLATDEAACRAIVAKGAVDCIASAIMAFPTEMPIQIASLWALANIAATTRIPAHCQIVFEAGGADFAFEIMKTHATNEMVQLYGCELVLALSLDRGYRFYMADKGGIDLIAGLLTAYRAHEGIVTVALMALNNFLCESNVAARAVLAARPGGLDACVVARMKAYPAVPAVQEYGARILAMFVDDMSFLTRFIESGDFAELILPALQRGRLQDTNVAFSLLTTALVRLPKHREYLESLGAIDLVLGIMSSHAGNSDLTINGCSTLLTLSRGDEDHRRRIIQAQGTDILLKVMKAQPGSATLHLLACTTLVNLSVEHNFSVPKESLAVVLESRKHHSKFEKLHETIDEVLKVCGVV